MAKYGDLDIIAPTGGSCTGFTSEQIVLSGVSVNGCGNGVTIKVERDDEPVIPSTRLTLEEGWVLYTTLRGMFYKTRAAEFELYKSKHNRD